MAEPPPGTPDDPERRRLEILGGYEILDTAPEVAFDQIVDMAQSTFDTPVVLLSLVDASRQWFKARIGLELAETPREIAFCGHPIRSDQVIVVRDARDRRFADNPLVTGGPRIRFYAGAPLIAREGARLGALDVIAPRRRGFSTQDRQRLQILAGIASNALEWRRQVRLGRRAADEQALLVREVEHRVGCSLGLVLRVLEAQDQARAPDQSARHAILGVANRLAGLETLHYQLCGESGFGGDARGYLLALLGSLEDALLETGQSTTGQSTTGQRTISCQRGTEPVGRSAGAAWRDRDGTGDERSQARRRVDQSGVDHRSGGPRRARHRGVGGRQRTRTWCCAAVPRGGGPADRGHAGDARRPGADPARPGRITVRMADGRTADRLTLAPKLI